MQTHNQQGMATLAVALALLLGATIMTLAMAKTGLLEQRMTGNELRITEVRHRAEAALEEAMAELGGRRIPGQEWLPQEDGLERAGLAAAPTLQQAGAGGEGYQIQVAVQRLAADPSLIEVIVEAETPSGVAARVRQHARILESLDQELPPVIVDGCISGGGGVQLFPLDPGNWSLATTLAHPAAGCMDTGELFLEGGDIATGYAEVGNLWDALFALSKEEHQQRSEREQAAVEAGELDAGERTYYWINESGDQWHQDLPGLEQGVLGAPDHPVWLLFSAAADCPPLPPGITIHGILYYETGESGACDAGGWGNAQVIGSLLVEGDLEDLAGGGTFQPFAAGGQGGLLDRLPPLRSVRLPGTWRDF